MADISRLSHSQMSQYMLCGEQYRLMRVEKAAPRKDGLASFAGSAFHSWCDEYDRGNYADAGTWANHWDQTIGYSQLAEKDPRLFKVSRKEDIDWWRVNGEKFASRYIDWRAESQWECVAIEHPFTFEFPIPHGLPLLGDPEVSCTIGFVDRVFRTPSGKLVIVDMKSGARVYPSSQLYEYYAALRAEGMEIEAVTYYDVRRGRTTGLEYPKTWTSERLTALCQQVYTGIVLDIFPANVGNHCDIMCDARAVCSWVNFYGEESE